MSITILHYVSTDTPPGGLGSTSSNIDLSRAFQAQGQEFHAKEESDHDQPSRPGGDPDAAWLEIGKAIKGPVMQLKVEVVWVGKCIYTYIYIYICMYMIFLA